MTTGMMALSPANSLALESEHRASIFTLRAIPRSRFFRSLGCILLFVILGASATFGQQPPVVKLTMPSSGAMFAAPARITLEADASDSDGFVSSVRFLSGSSLIGTDSLAPFSLIWSNGFVGMHTLRAVSTDNQGNTETSAPVNVQIQATTTSTIQAGETKQGTFNVAGQVDQYEFTVLAGEVVIVLVGRGVCAQPAHHPPCSGREHCDQ